MSFTQQDLDSIVEDAIAGLLTELNDVWSVAGLNPESELDVLEMELKAAVVSAHTRLVNRIDEQTARLKRGSRR